MAIGKARSKGWCGTKTPSKATIRDKHVAEAYNELEHDVKVEESFPRQLHKRPNPDLNHNHDDYNDYADVDHLITGIVINDDVDGI